MVPPPEASVSGKCNSVRWSARTQAAKDAAAVEFDCALQKGTFPKEKYETHRQRLEEAFSILSQGVSWRLK